MDNQFGKSRELLIIGTFLLLFSPKLFALPSNIKCPVSDPITKEEEVNYSTIETLMNKDLAKFKDPSLLLACLPESFRQNFALIKQTSSQQSASATSPRALLYSKDGKVLMTINDSAEDPKIEFIEADEKGEFTPKQILFPVAKDPDRSKIDFQPKPTSCAGCHAQGDSVPKVFRPKWEAYDIWPGVYGSLSSFGSDFMPPNECDDYKKFLNTQNKPDKIYSLLDHAPAKEVKSASGVKQGCKFDSTIGSKQSPAGHLNHLLQEIMSRKAISKLKDGIKNDKRMRYALLMSAMGCNQLDKSYTYMAGGDSSASTATKGKSLDDTESSLSTHFKEDENKRLTALAATDEYDTYCKLDPGTDADAISNRRVRGDAYILVPKGKCKDKQSCSNESAKCKKTPPKKLTEVEMREFEAKEKECLAKVFFCLQRCLPKRLS